MFLMGLTESEKKNFLELVNIIACSDGELGVDGEKLIQAYRLEMNLPKEDYKIEGKSLDDILRELSGSDRSTKRKIFLEILALARSDKKYLESEKKFLGRVAESFGIGEEDYRNFVSLVNDLRGIYEKVLKLVEG